MSLETDALIDRRRLRRSLAFWRILAVIALFAGFTALTVYWTGADIGFGKQFPHIARVPIGGTIVSDRKLVEQIKEIGESDSVKGVIVAINSPGGTTVGGEMLYNALRELSGKKPTVAQIETLGTSAGYLVAVATDHIVAHHTTITGSVGVLVQYPQIFGLLDELGVKFLKVESGRLKAEPSPFEPSAPGATEMLQEIVDNSFVWFKGIVAERRHLTPQQVDAISSGRIYTGAQALQENLVDTIGGEEAAIGWLESARDVPEDLPVRDWRPRSDSSLPFTSRLADRMAARLLAAIGLPTSENAAADARLLDGLMSLWQAPIPSTKGTLKTGGQ